MSLPVILISHPLRGKKYSALRREDARAIRRIVDTLRNEGEVIPFVPYLLHGETNEDIVGLRIEGNAGYHLMAFEGVWLYGEELCLAMRAEILRASHARLPIVYKNPVLEIQVRVAA